MVHIGCEAASFARDIGLYRGHGYAVEKIRVFDAFPLTHHIECVALLTRASSSEDEVAQPQVERRTARAKSR